MRFLVDGGEIAAGLHIKHVGTRTGVHNLVYILASYKLLVQRSLAVLDPFT